MIQIADIQQFSLFQLYNAICKFGIQISGASMSKGILLDILNTRDISIDCIKDCPTFDWTLILGEYHEFSISIKSPEFVIFEGDKIRGADGKVFEIDTIYIMDDDYRIYYLCDDSKQLKDACRIVLRDIDNDSLSTITGNEFMYAVNCIDVCFVKSKWLKYLSKFTA
jgi:hypothetical protein